MKALAGVDGTNKSTETKEQKMKRTVKEIIQMSTGVQFFVLSVAGSDGVIDTPDDSSSSLEQTNKSKGQSTLVSDNRGRFSGCPFTNQTTWPSSYEPLTNLRVPLWYNFLRSISGEQPYNFSKFAFGANLYLFSSGAPAEKLWLLGQQICKKFVKTAFYLFCSKIILQRRTFCLNKVFIVSW